MGGDRAAVVDPVRQTHDDREASAKSRAAYLTCPLRIDIVMDDRGYFGSGYGRYKVGVSPQGRQSGTQRGKFVPQDTRRSCLDRLDQPMYPELRGNFEHEMCVDRADFHRGQPSVLVLHHFDDDRSQPLLNVAGYHRRSVLGAPHDIESAVIGNLFVYAQRRPSVIKAHLHRRDRRNRTAEAFPPRSDTGTQYRVLACPIW